jgi:hypothetical protein
MMAPWRDVGSNVTTDSATNLDAVLAAPGLAGGPAELAAAGRPDLSIEALVLEGPFSALFTERELAVARERLGR